MAKKVRKKELGLGVRALLSNIDTKVEENKEEVVKELSSAVAMIPIEQIIVNPEQPRKEFEAEALQELCDSIKVHGIIQPLTIRRMGGNTYQLISGERRLRASKLAGLTEVPAYIRLANDQEMLEMALIENIQRAELNPMEIALTYSRLQEEFKLTQEKLAYRVGKKRLTITAFLGLLELPPSIQTALKNREISVGHAKVLKGIKDLSLQLDLFQRITRDNLSVRETEALARALKETATASKKKPSNNLPQEYRHIEDNLRNYLGSRVQLKLKGKENGNITINFGSTEELNRILELIEK